MAKEMNKSNLKQAWSEPTESKAPSNLDALITRLDQREPETPSFLEQFNAAPETQQKQQDYAQLNPNLQSLLDQQSDTQRPSPEKKSLHSGTFAPLVTDDRWDEDTGSWTVAPDENRFDPLYAIAAAETGDSSWYDAIPEYMTFNGEQIPLNYNDEQGRWDIPQNYYDVGDRGIYGIDDNAQHKMGDLADDYYLSLGDDGQFHIYPRDLEKTPTPGAIGWRYKNSDGTWRSDVLENPSEFERDAYSVITSNEFKDFMKEHGYEDFDRDMAYLQSPEGRAGWQYMVERMREMPSKFDDGYIWFDDDYNNPLFADENGQFSWDNYWNWVDNNANLMNLALGNITEEGADWLARGGLGANRLLANTMANIPGLRFGILGNEYLDDDFIKAMSDAYTNGTMTTDEWDNLYVPGYSLGLGKDAETGQYYGVSQDPAAMRQYILQNLIMESLSNEALDANYGAYTPNAYDAMQAGNVLGQSDLYWDRTNSGPDELIDNPYEYWGGNPEAYRNFWTSSYGDLNNYMNGANRQYNLGATAGKRNQNLRRMYPKE